MLEHQDIVWNVTGQSLTFDVPEGRPSSVTSVSVFRWDDGDDATAQSATTGASSIDSVNTTFDADSGKSQANPRQANLTATTSIAAGRMYLATDAQGRKEWITVQGITSGQAVATLHAMGLDYVSGDTFVGTRISISVSSTWIADRSNINLGADAWDRHRVRWVYVVGGVTYVRQTTFSVVRRAGGHTVQSVDVDLRFPGLLKLVEIDYRSDRTALLIDKAYDEFSTDLYALKLPDELVIAPKHIDELVVLKTAVIVLQSKAILGGEPLGMETAERLYRERFNDLFRASTAKVPIGLDNTGAGRERGALPLSRR